MARPRRSPKADPLQGLEVEIKFELTAHDARALWRSAPFKALMRGTPRKQTLRATYFDTPNLDLSARGVSMRVRKEGRRTVQCVKAGTDGPLFGGFARREWEWPVSGTTRDVALDIETLKGEAALKPVLKGVALKSLVPIFTTDIQRHSRIFVTPGGTKVRCDIDRGRILSGEGAEAREAMVHEMELELLSGDMRDVLALARLVTTVVPARLSTRTKAQRGFGLFAGDGPGWAHAEPLKVAPSASAEDVLQGALHAELRHLIANEDGVLARGDAEGVHQMRVALRRMRALISTVKKHLAKDTYEDLTKGLRNATNALGPARDWDVFLGELLVPVEAAISGKVDRAALSVLRARAEQQRRAGYDQADQLIASPAYARLLGDVLWWAGTCAWRGDKGAGPLAKPARSVGREMLARRHDYVVKAAKGLKQQSAAQRHSLRIAVKKARYGLEFFQSVYGTKKTHAYREALRTLQDQLGHLNDLAMAQRLMADLIKSARGANAKSLAHAAGLVEGWYAQAQDAREKDLVKAWKDFSRAKPFWK